MTDIEETLNERQERYGDFSNHARITQNIKFAMNDGNWSDLSSDKKEALEMIAHKIGRVLNGDPNYIDSWRDIIGYALLVENNLLRTDGATDNRVIQMKVTDGKMIDV